jgi:hypothetical protein
MSRLAAASLVGAVLAVCCGCAGDSLRLTTFSGPPQRVTPGPPVAAPYSLADLRTALNHAGVVTSVQRFDRSCTAPRNGFCSQFFTAPKGTRPQDFPLALVLPRGAGRSPGAFTVSVYASAASATTAERLSHEKALVGFDGSHLSAARKGNLLVMYTRKSGLPPAVERAFAELPH